MIVAIVYDVGDPLEVTLSSVQPQLSTKDEIVVIDRSPDRSGLQIAKKYGSNRCLIYVEVGNLSNEECARLFEEYVIDKKQDGRLTLKNVLLSQTFIPNLKKAMSLSGASVLFPQVLASNERLDPNFDYYQTPTKPEHMSNTYTRSPGLSRCFFIRNFGEGSAMFNNEKVALL
jgi:glycosyltransferase involved in cell wall biosynthesis